MCTIQRILTSVKLEFDESSIQIQFKLLPWDIRLLKRKTIRSSILLHLLFINVLLVLNAISRLILNPWSRFDILTTLFVDSPSTSSFSLLCLMVQLYDVYAQDFDVRTVCGDSWNWNGIFSFAVRLSGDYGPNTFWCRCCEWAYMLWERVRRRREAIVERLVQWYGQFLVVDLEGKNLLVYWLGLEWGFLLSRGEGM